MVKSEHNYFELDETSQSASSAADVESCISGSTLSVSELECNSLEPGLPSEAQLQEFRFSHRSKWRYTFVEFTDDNFKEPGGTGGSVISTPVLGGT